MSADFGTIAGTGMNMVGTMVGLSIISKVGQNTVNNLNRQGGGYRRRAPVYNARRSMSHKSMYRKTPRHKSYSIFS